MNKKLLTPMEIELHEDQPVSFMKLSGELTEDNPLQSLDLKNPRIIIDLSEITRINSCGVRDWVKWVADRRESLFLVECATVFIVQVNMIYGFLGDAAMLSLNVPLYCGECDEDSEDLLISFLQAKESSYRLPACSTCGQTCELGDMEESYFAFLKSLKGPSIDDELLSVLSRFVPRTAAFYGV